jgi:lysophospholipase L1-like esterase
MPKTAKLFFKVALSAIYLALLGYHILQLCLGRASVISTILFYILITLLLVGLVSLIASWSRKIRSSKKNLLLLIISVLFFLLCIELILRYVVKNYTSYTELNKEFYYQSYFKKMDYDNFMRKYRWHHTLSHYWVHDPNYSGYCTRPEFNYLHTYNSMGLREREIQLNKDAAEFRIIGLGDSMTEGIGTAQDSTWTLSLERVLIDSLPGITITTINAGASGSDPFFEYILLRDKLLQYHPDMVILSLNSSDIHDIFVRGGMERFKPNDMVKYRKGPWWEYIYSFSFICRHLIHIVFGYDVFFIHNSEYQAVHDSITDQILTLCNEIDQLSKKNNFTFIIQITSFSHEFNTDKQELTYLEEAIKNKTDIPVVSTFEYFRDHGVKADNAFDYFWKLDAHCNAKGYDLIGRCMAEELMRMKAIKINEGRKDEKSYDF